MSTEVQLMIFSAFATAIAFGFRWMNTHDKKLAITESDVKHSHEEIKQLVANLTTNSKEDFAEMRSHLEKVERRLDSFLSAEIQLLKDLSKNK